MGGGLAMSRSLGDACYHPHVISKPEIHERHLDSRDKVLILGSDGVWDQMSSQDAVSIARRHKDTTMAARQITDVAKKRWVAETGGTMSDDITAVVLHLDHRAPSSAQRSSRAPSESSGRRSTSSRMECVLDPGSRAPPFKKPNHSLPPAGYRNRA